MSNPKKLIAVFGATGLQGGGVLKELKRKDKFRLRAITRDASKARGLADEVVEADLTSPDTLAAAVSGAHGVFLVTNFWAGPDVDELAQVRAAVDAAKAAGVEHFVWSTLPNVAKLSGGKLRVPHFTGKAEGDALVSDAGFARHTFVEAPFYYQNLTTLLAPQKQPDGTGVWALPMDPQARVIHMGDATELGTLVAAAFENPEQLGNGQRLALAGEFTSWQQIIETLAEQGHRIAYERVPAAVFDEFFPGAPEIRVTMEYFEAHTYFGPDASQKLELAKRFATSPPTRFADWAKVHMPA